MVEFINKLTGGKMLVAEDRVEEYKAMGHTVASSIIAEVKAVEIPVETEKTTKKRKGKE